MASKATVRNRKSSKTDARAKTTTANNNRPHVATRSASSPMEVLSAVCAKNTPKLPGPLQQEWLAMWSHISRFSEQQQQQSGSTASTTEAPRSMTASA